MTKTDGVDSVVAGLTDSYTITVANAGPSAVTGAPVTDTFPAALTGVTWTCAPTGWRQLRGAERERAPSRPPSTCPPARRRRSPPRASAPGATGALANTATVTPPPGTTDPNPGDDTATDTTTITPSADVQVTKAGSPSPVTAGNPITFTVVVTNAGPSTATDVVITDPPPAGLAFGTITGACTAFPCTIPTLAPGASATITATVSIPRRTVARIRS